MKEIIIRFELVMPWWTNLYFKLLCIAVFLGFSVDTVAASMFVARYAKCKMAK